MSRPRQRSVRVGVIADSHVGEFLDRMPDWVSEAMTGSDLILHAGDLSVPSVLEDLALIAPVRAVLGDHDRELDDLPRSLVVSVRGWRIGVVHGSWSGLWDAATVARQTLPSHVDWQARLERELLNRMGAVDALVYGHWHIPRIATQGSALMICPGAVCPGGALAEGAPIPRTLHAPIDVMVRRFRRQMGPDRNRPAVAVLDVGSSGVRARHIFAPTPPPTE
jgi:putative phosphoesterase